MPPSSTQSLTPVPCEQQSQPPSDTLTKSLALSHRFSRSLSLREQLNVSSSPSDIAASSGVRAKSKEANRRKILESAYVLFRDRGFDAATLRDIARNAGLSTGAVFANFADKSEIFIKVVETENTRIVSLMLDAHDPTLPLNGRLHHQIMSGYRAAIGLGRIIMAAFVMKWTPDTPGFIEVARLNEMMRQAILETLVFARGRGELKADAPIEIATEVLEDLCFSALRRASLYNLSEEMVSERLSFQINLVVAGISASVAVA
jgi:AcrR family transcriptional regulator